MLQFSANGFFWSGRALRTIRGDCLAGAAVCVNGQLGFALGKDLDDQAKEKALSSLSVVEASFRQIGLTIAADTTSELVDELKEPYRHSFDWLINQVDAIERLAEKELKGQFFLYIPKERTRFWPTVNEPNLFGDRVATNFRSAKFDIANAGMSLAAMLTTASVFHLMRVMEIGLTVLGAKFNVSLAHTNWAPAIELIESRIREMHKDPIWKALPDCKEQQEWFAQAANHFAITKDAWRNYTMHARGKYTEPEAEMIYDSVKSFMQKMAERLSE